MEIVHGYCSVNDNLKNLFSYMFWLRTWLLSSRDRLRENNGTLCNLYDTGIISEEYHFSIHENTISQEKSLHVCYYDNNIDILDEEGSWGKCRYRRLWETIDIMKLLFSWNVIWLVAQRAANIRLKLFKCISKLLKQDSIEIFVSLTYEENLIHKYSLL